MCHPATNKVTPKKRQTLPEDKIDLVGCFLPWNSSHFAGLNARRFMNNPKDNVDVCHPATNKVTTKKEKLYLVSRQNQQKSWPQKHHLLLVKTGLKPKSKESGTR